MGLWLLCFMMTLSTAFADIGKVLKLTDKSEAHIIRNKSKIELKSDSKLEVGDVVVAGNSNLLLQLYPETQVILTKSSELLIEQSDLEVTKKEERAFSVLKLQKGSFKAHTPSRKTQVIEQRWETEGASAAATQGEFEMALSDSKNVDVDVFQGQLIVSSPFIQSFVPEVVKAKEGLTFVSKDKAFSRREAKSNLGNEPSFMADKVVRKSWDKIKKKFSKKTKK
ncbi:hypothetical protein [Peredibacter starrii]|uniref:FecR protein domain-containing protein n=1 Tax=Peredibacter starrii TaxID=28202 RepID=A0AAX4HPP0_9BACT|nr:hypothetical protein [Peredibacter starrii]WPU65162.1 hypothetical protein SOO65_00165 [Peredibacter starrii]